MTAPWRPNVGDHISGEIIDIREGGTEYGPYPIYRLRTLLGVERDVHAYHAVLQRALSSKTAGDRVAIVYHGKRQAARNKDRSYHSYEVARLVEPDDGEGIPF